MFSIVAFTLASALAASAADITVNVGANNQLIFDPPQVTAQPGDQIHFQFQSKNHSVTQSTFASPCVKSPTGIDSGFMAVASDATSQPVWTMQVSDTTPLWFFCAQTVPAVHCTAGMVFAVNPTADKTFDQFQSLAKSGGSASNTTSPSGSVIPAPSSLPTGGSVTGASGAAPAASGFSTQVAAGGPSATTGAAGAASSSAAPNGAVGLSSAGAVSLVSMFAAVAGLML